MAAGVLERLHVSVLGAHHHHGLVEDLVLHEVVCLRDLLEPTGHLPHAGPQQIDFHLEEIGVVVALLAGPIGVLEGVRHRSLLIHDHQQSLPLRSA